jgi:hypothetical protein
LRSAPGRGYSLSARFQIALHEAALGPVHRRAAHANAPGDLRVAGSGVGSQQNLRSLELAGRMLAAAEQHLEFRALDLVEVDPLAYIHGVPPCSRHAPTTESDGRRESFGKAFTPKQGQYLAFIHLYAAAPRAPAETDMQEYFRVSPPSVHQMVLTLERAGLIRRQPRTPRSVELLV